MVVKQKFQMSIFYIQTNLRYIKTKLSLDHTLKTRISISGVDGYILSTIVFADLQLVDNADGIVDFGAVPYGCETRVPLTITNKSNVNANLVVKILPVSRSHICSLDFSLLL